MANNMAPRVTRSRLFLSFVQVLALPLTKAFVVPNDLPGVWQYQGCYIDVDRTLTQDSYTDTTDMTDESCISFCASNGYQYAGTEWYQECYCGNSLASGGVLAADQTDCNTACVGNSSEACGGPLRLSLFYSSQPVGPQPNSGVPDWPYIGCYAEGTTGRALTYTVTTIPDDEMNAANCTAACQEQGYILAGTEYSGQCYCGNSFANGGGPAPDGTDQCDMVCSGNSSEICGGPNRLDVYDFQMLYPVSSTTSSTSSSTATALDPPSTSTTTSAASTASATPATCPDSNGTIYTTLNDEQFTLQCYVDHTGGDLSMAYTDSYSDCVETCSTTATCIAVSWVPGAPGPCYMKSSIEPGNADDGVWGAIIYTPSQGSSTTSSGSSTTATTPTTSVSTSTTSASSTPTAITCPDSNGTVYTTSNDDAFLLQCYIDHTGGDLSTAYSDTYSDCVETCSTTDTCVAVSWVPGTPGPCYMKSTIEPGNADDGVWGAIINSSSTATQPTTSTTGPTTSATSTSSSTPVPDDEPTGWTYQGCWIDNAFGSRVLSYTATPSDNMTQEYCSQTCYGLGYNVSGTEYSRECYCGDYIVDGGSQAPDSDCNMACSGDSSEMCGAGNRLTVFSPGPIIAYPVPVAQTSGLVGSWTYQGCYSDLVNNTRALPWELILTDTNSANECLSQCAAFGYMAAGMEYFDQCFCGDPADVIAAGSTLTPDSDCNTPCSGNQTGICGGQNRLSLYYWTGDPLYTWEYPTGADAGEYVFLIGGVCIPLMTMQAITGKVVFVEKWGTGPPNSTGTYELDLTEINNFTAAWRPLHVKTDVFCSAGIVLPDKVGRMMNVGGWSAPSTFGMRLYWPDGSPGVWGTNDWQENVNELSLQQGRWYPGIVQMANGSILVVGGEQGSNGAPVPTMEIVPSTGTPPLYCDYLEETDPNNLYPFLTVLPGGGIFIAYYNQARILDEVTLETTSILPGIPGSVLDPSAGRTYPLEGTMVLFPQHYPYTDPLGILICGGSTPFGGQALDNCVSIYPEVPNANWTLERMPSKRVMTCIAPLPDGTYLILNGAQQGVAGFGLATDPNLNAVLYDPTKPYGARMSVMANTTVARLYHSEAITLLDGRVLVSGSDPEDGVNPQEYRVETFLPPYLLSGLPRPSFTIDNTDWAYNDTGIPITLGGPPQNGEINISLLGAVSSTHGNSFGARTLFPNFSCAGTTCTVDAPPGPYIAPPGWYQLFVLDGGIPAVGTFVRIGGDPAELGNWPNFPDFSDPGM